jgi:TPP-dependent pyruvate/acetoin dehydrogenase alpha subunit
MIDEKTKASLREALQRVSRYNKPENIILAELSGKELDGEDVIEVLRIFCEACPWATQRDTARVARAINKKRGK